MKRIYVTPELEIVKFTMKDVLLGSIIEETIPEIIGGGDIEPTELPGDDL